MSLPAKTLAIKHKTEVFPTPVSPIRTIVYGAFALFFDMVTIPLSRDSMLLLKTIRTTPDMSCDLLDRRDVGLIIEVGNLFTLCQNIPTWVSNSVGGYKGEALVAGRAIRVVFINDSRVPERLTT